MLKTLIKLNIASLVNAMLGGARQRKNAKNPKKRSVGQKILYLLLLVYVLGVFVWLFTQIFGMMAAPLQGLGMGWLYFLFVFIAAFAVMFIFNIFAAKNRLYEAKDNDLLLSLPIKPSHILMSRMALLLIMNLATGVIITAPALYCWLSVAEMSTPAAAMFVLLFLALCFFTLAISALFGWLLSIASARVGKKALFETVFSLAFLAVYFYFYSQINMNIQKLIANAGAIADSMSGLTPLLWIGRGAAGEPMSFLAAMLLFILPFILVFIVLSRTFIKTATSKRGTVKKKYEAKEAKEKSAARALIERELQHFFSSSIVIMNHGLGVIFLVISSVLLVVYKSTILSFLAGFGEFGSPDLVPVICAIAVLTVLMLAGISMPSSSSVSLEGRSLWIVRSLPVSSAQILRAKLAVSLGLFLPAVLLCSLAAIYVFEPGAEIAAFMLLCPLGVVTVMAELGLILNLRHPMLDWTTETQPVKSGMAVLFSMLSDFGIIALLGIGGYIAGYNGVSMELILLAATLLSLLAARLLYGYIIGKGTARFEEL